MITVNELNTAARAALAKTLRVFAARVAPVRAPAPAAAAAAPGGGADYQMRFGGAVERVVQAAVRAALSESTGAPRPPSMAEQARRSGGETPRQVSGAGWIDLAWKFLDPDPEQQKLWGSEEAMYGRFTTAAGPTPQAYSTEASIDLSIERLAVIYAEANRDGYLTHLMDLNFEVHQKWGHLQSAHRQRTAAVYRNPLQLRPRSKSDLGRFVCSFVRGVLDDIPGFVKAEEDLLAASRNGFAGQEIVWQTPRARRVTVGRKTYTIQNAKGIEALEWVHPRNFRWDPIKRRMLLDSGGTRFVNPFRNPDGSPTRKLIFHGGPGDGDPHQRGYGFGTNLLYLLSFQSVSRWMVALDLFGVSTPYMQYEGEGFADAGDITDAIEFIQALGRGQPAVLHRKFGEVKLTPTPTGIDARGQHAAILGYLNSEASKHVAGQTLTMEIGGSGSYAAANTHSDSKEDVQIIDARLEADTQTHQTVRYIVEENAVQLARAFGCSPAEVLAESPIAYRIVDRRMDPKDRLAVFTGVSLPPDKGGLGLRVDPDQVAEELNVRLLEEDDEEPEAPALSKPEERQPPEPAQRSARAGKWEENDHPRADDGKFGSGSGGSSGGSGSAGAAKGKPGAAPSDWHPPEKGPGPLRDHAHAYEWLQQNYPHVDAQLDQMHSDLLQSHVERFHALCSQHPEVARDVKALRVRPAERFAPKNMAMTNVQAGTIDLNAGYYSDPERLRRFDSAGVDRGFYPAGTKAEDATLTHEFGHLVDAHLRANSDPKQYRAWIKDNLTTDIPSRYSMVHIRETFAECFRQMVHAPEGQWSGATRRMAKLFNSEEWKAWKK